MNSRFARMMFLIAIMATLGITFLLLRPSPDRPLFWALLVPAIAANLGYMILSKREDKEYQSKTDKWIEELRSLVGDDDLHATLERDPHFADFGGAEREQILRALQNQPDISRSLESALIETGLDFREP